jgi:hypothetical protein
VAKVEVKASFYKLYFFNARKKNFFYRVRYAAGFKGGDIGAGCSWSVDIGLHSFLLSVTLSLVIEPSIQGSLNQC